MKKIAAALFAAFLSISLTACGGTESQGQGSSGNVSVNEDNDMESGLDAAEESVQKESEEKSAQPEDNGKAEDSAANQDTLDTKGTKTLVVYFSATGTTKGIAEQTAEILQADIYEIVPPGTIYGCGFRLA